MARYHVRVRPQVWQEIKRLPGDVRQRVKRAVDDLADEPRLARTKVLDTHQTTLEVRRLRGEKWMAD